MHVPLLIRAPYDVTAGRRVSDTVRSVDILPTALELLGVKAPDKLEGTSLVPLITGAKKELGLAAYSEAIYPRFHFGWSDLRALTAGRYKFVAAPRPELYDLQQDPTESRNIYPERQALGDRLNQELIALERGMSADAPPPRAAVEVDPDARARLAALGYVGTFVSGATPDRAGLADPKDKIQLFNLMTKARETARHDQESDEGLHALELEPKLAAARNALGVLALKRGDLAGADREIRAAIAEKPDVRLAHYNLALLAEQQGDLQRAIAEYKKEIDLHANSYKAAFNLGRLYERVGDRS